MYRRFERCHRVEDPTSVASFVIVALKIVLAIASKIQSPGPLSVVVCLPSVEIGRIRKVRRTYGLFMHPNYWKLLNCYWLLSWLRGSIGRNGIAVVPEAVSNSCKLLSITGLVPGFWPKSEPPETVMGNQDSHQQQLATSYNLVVLLCIAIIAVSSSSLAWEKHHTHAGWCVVRNYM